jgi:hypothetical protein
LCDAVRKTEDLAADVLGRVEVSLEGLLGGDLLRRLVWNDAARSSVYRTASRNAFAPAACPRAR